MKEKDMKEKVKGPWPGTPTIHSVTFPPYSVIMMMMMS